VGSMLGAGSEPSALLAVWGRRQWGPFQQNNIWGGFVLFFLFTTLSLILNKAKPLKGWEASTSEWPQSSLGGMLGPRSRHRGGSSGRGFPLTFWVFSLNSA